MRRLNAACGLLAMGVVLGTGATPAYADGEPALTVERPDDLKGPADPVRWSVAGSIGPIVMVKQWGGVWPPVYIGTGSSPVTAWQLEVLRRRDDRRMIFGGGLEGTYGGRENVGPQLLGAHAFAGGDWRYRSLGFEATLGVGLEAAEVDVAYTVQSDPRQEVRGIYATYHLGVYGQGAVAAALSVSDSIDVLLQFAVHFTVSHDETWFGASMIGLRYKLP